MFVWFALEETRIRSQQKEGCVHSLKDIFWHDTALEHLVHVQILQQQHHVKNRPPRGEHPSLQHTQTRTRAHAHAPCASTREEVMRRLAEEKSTTVAFPVEWHQTKQH